MNVRWITVSLWLLGTLPVAAGAQSTDDRITELLRRAEQSQVAPVVIDGETLIRVRGVSAYPAEERAELIRRQIIAVARDESVAVTSGRIEQAPDRARIFFGDTLVVSLVNADAEIEDIELALLAETALIRISAAIGDYRESRSADPLLRSTLVLFVITLTTALLIFLTIKLFGRLNRFVSYHAQRTGERLGSGPRRLVDVQQIVLWSHGPLRALLYLLLLVITLTWLNMALGLYPWTRAFASRVLDLVLDPLRALGTGLLSQIPNIVFLVMLAFIVRLVIGGAKRFFSQLDQGTIPLGSFDREWALPTYRIVRLLILAFALIVAYPYIPGSNSEAFKGISIFLGVILSIGSSSFIGSMIAGYSLIYRRAFRKDDLVRIGDLMGFVVETRMLSTQLRSIKNELINIPNSTVLNSEIVNFSSLQQKPGLILHTTVSIGYDVPWRQVESLLLAAADRTDGIEKEPAPFVLQKELGDFAIVYELNAYCIRSERMGRLYSALHANILDAFNDAGVQIMSPHYESDPAEPKVVAKTPVTGTP